jgi:tetratricopeptide (TPR) repeat protein
MLVGNFVMSASALKLTPVRLVMALGFAVPLMVIACVDPAHAQNSVTATQVVQLVARVRAASPGDATLLNAVPLGQRLLMEQRYGEASELFKALLDKLPREPAVLYGAALATFNVGRPAEAEPLVRAAAEIYLAGVAGKGAASSVASGQRSSGANALVLLAVILGARGADTEALKTIQRAVALTPENFDAQFTLARALYSVGDYATAVKAFRTALALKPDDARSLFFLATALESAGDIESALAAYRNLVARKPQASEGHLGLGVLLIKRGGGDVEKGIQELKTAVNIDPNLYEAQVTLGRALLGRKLLQESVEHLQRAAELAPRNPEPHYQLALAYRRLGLTDKAVEETAIVKRIHDTRRGEGPQNNNPTRPD